MHFEFSDGGGILSYDSNDLNEDDYPNEPAQTIGKAHFENLGQ